MPNSLPLVQLQVLLPLISGLKERGIDPEPILDSVGLTMNAVEQEGSSVHVMVIHQFVENCATATNDRTFCATIGAQLDPTGWPMVAMALKQAETLGEFLNIYVVQTTKVALSVTPYLDIRGDKATFGEKRKFKPLIEPIQNDGFMIGLKLAIIEKVLGPQIQPEQVFLVLCDPTVLPLRFGRYQMLKGDNMGPRIRFPSDWLALPTMNRQKETARPSKPEVLGQHSFLAGFRKLLEQHIGQGGLLTADAAKLVHMHPKALARRLSALGTTTSRELTAARLVFAKNALTQSDRTVEAIASALGYADPSNFARTFSKHEKKTPTQFRADHREPKD